MTHENDCNYCKSKFKYKYPYREWREIALLLYKKSVKRMGPTQSITFMYNDKPFMIDETGNGPYSHSGYYVISLIEAMNNQEATDKGAGQWDYHWPTETPPLDKDLKILQDMSEDDSTFDLDIDAWDKFGDGLHHHCGIIKITGGEHVKIWLEEVWDHD